jgi:hypothetical protein
MPAVAWTTDDRSLKIEQNQKVVTNWIPINNCYFANRDRMSPEAVEVKYRKLLCQSGAAIWPPINGIWVSDRFEIHDGRHEYVACLMLGYEKIFVAWVEENNELLQI